MPEAAFRPLFLDVAMAPENPLWEQATSRREQLYRRAHDLRSPFSRDYNRILHCTAYRRLKHKTQVFFAPQNDHICTRIEHVAHVMSVAETIATALGLNRELTAASAIGHDLGHAPFGHSGESVLKALARERNGSTFWHERNSLRFVDELETLEDPGGTHRHLNLTYGVRDAIVCHCGEVGSAALRPRNEALPLEGMDRPAQHEPFTWEGCVVKLSDKIAYLGRDIEDALATGILTPDQRGELDELARGYGEIKAREINNTVLLQFFIQDLRRHSDPDQGIRLSEKNAEFMERLKAFNYRQIYLHPKLEQYKKYVRLVLETLFAELEEPLNQGGLERVRAEAAKRPTLYRVFLDWLEKYSTQGRETAPPNKFGNRVLYDLDTPEGRFQTVLDFISGMTDNYALRSFEELISF
ncbi:MAG: deoxyguanosinetriphosphate triphosphohydrolase family protein [Desulfovibrio sp.]